MSNEAILEKMTLEFCETGSGAELSAASHAYNDRYLKVLQAAAKQEEATKRAEKVAAEEEKIEETIQKAQQELEKMSNKTVLPGEPSLRRSTRVLPAQTSRESSAAQEKLEDLKRQKQEKENDRKRSLDEAKAAEQEATEAAKKVTPSVTKPRKKPKKEPTNLLDIAASGSPDSVPPLRRGKRLTYKPPGACWKAAAISVTSMLSICHDIIKSECHSMELDWEELEVIKKNQETCRIFADYNFLTQEVKTFKKEHKRQPTAEEIAEIVHGGNSPSLDALLGDAFIQNAIIELDFLDTSEFLDSEGKTDRKKIKVKNIRPSILSWMSPADAADLCWHLKCIEHIKINNKVREFKVLIRLNFGADFKEKMLNILDKLTAKKAKKKATSKKQSET